MSVLLFAANIMHRADYLDRGLTPHLLDISKQGLRAKFMKPVFPVSSSDPYGGTSLTFPTDIDFPVSDISYRVSL
jgi:hypothetical protein